MRLLDRIFAIVLLVGAVGHTLGSFRAYSSQPMPLFWALNASVLVALLGVLNLLRAKRPADRVLAWITAAGTLCWLIGSIIFGMLIGHPLDPRVLTFLVVSAGLVLFSVQTALSPARA
jgi:hypothetical protein